MLPRIAVQVTAVRGTFRWSRRRANRNPRRRRRQRKIFSRLATRHRKKKNMPERKRSENQFISMWYRIESLPRRVPKRRALEVMRDIVNFDRTRLPQGWDITWFWRNDEEGEEHFGPIRQVARDELRQNRGDGFLTLMSRRIERDLSALTPRYKKRSRK
jgi:hypothetical protein